jgi:hypothetical protein
MPPEQPRPSCTWFLSPIGQIAIIRDAALRLTGAADFVMRFSLAYSRRKILDARGDDAPSQVMSRPANLAGVSHGTEGKAGYSLRDE